jgi:hypothetical protein
MFERCSLPSDAHPPVPSTLNQLKGWWACVTRVFGDLESEVRWGDKPFLPEFVLLRLEGKTRVGPPVALPPPELGVVAR